MVEENYRQIKMEVFELLRKECAGLGATAELRDGKKRPGVQRGKEGEQSVSY